MNSNTLDTFAARILEICEDMITPEQHNELGLRIAAAQEQLVDELNETVEQPDENMASREDAEPEKVRWVLRDLLEGMCRVVKEGFATVEFRFMRHHDGKIMQEVTLYTSKTGHARGTTLADASESFKNSFILENDPQQIEQLARELSNARVGDGQIPDESVPF
jgi:hypothetical protein